LNQFPCGLKPVKKRKSRRPSRATGEVAHFIVGGEAADEGQHPWHASISTNFRIEDLERYDFCGGTLISNRAVLTGKIIPSILYILQIDNLLLSQPLTAFSIPLTDHSSKRANFQ